MFAKHRVLLLKVILHNAPKSPSRQEKECSSGVTDHIVKSHHKHDWPKHWAELEEYTTSAAFGTSFHQRRLKSTLPTCIFWVELTLSHGKAETMVIATEPSGTVYVSISWCGEVLTAPLILPQEPLAWKQIALWNLHSSQQPSQFSCPKDIAI